MWSHMLDSIYSIGFTFAEAEAPDTPFDYSPSQHPPLHFSVSLTPSAPDRPVALLPQIPSGHTGAGRGAGPPSALYSSRRPFTWTTRRRPFSKRRRLFFTCHSKSPRHPCSKVQTPPAGALPPPDDLLASRSAPAPSIRSTNGPMPVLHPPALLHAPLPRQELLHPTSDLLQWYTRRRPSSALLQISWCPKQPRPELPSSTFSCVVAGKRIYPQVSVIRG
jgi:hypothetical protein